MVSILHNKDFEAIYRDLGFNSTPSNDRLPLHECCKNRHECWKGADDRKPPNDEEWSKISRPWVGSKYSDLRLVAVGVNLNECGGFDALSMLLETAREEMVSTGRKRVRFDNSNYRGSLLWHRLGCYAVVFAQAAGLITPSYANQFPVNRDVGQAFEYIAYTNHIKCSPKGNWSEPTKKMWENCGGHVLRKELLELEPERILILGTSDNFRYFIANVLDPDITKPLNKKSVRIVSGKLGKKPVRVFAVDHPASRLGARKSILEDLRESLNDSR